MRKNGSIAKWIITLVVTGCLAFVFFGCSSLWQATKSAAAPAAGAGAGALLGSAAGPIGTIGGAMVGAAAADAIEENSQLRSGETVGEGALDNELERWKDRAIRADEAAGFAEQARGALKNLMGWALAGVLVWFVWRNRHNIRERGLVRGLVHSIFGGGFGRALRPPLK